MIDNSDMLRLAAQIDDSVTIAQPYDASKYATQIVNFYHQLSEKKEDKLTFSLNYFLNQPYLLEPIGEGENGKYSQEPLYRTDKFDCVSFVDTVLALIHANNLAEFEKNNLMIRYAKAQPIYSNRTDWFTDLEWIPNARSLGWLQNATDAIVDEQHKPIVLTAKTTIDKPNWYKVKPLKIMHLLEPLPGKDQINALLVELQAEGAKFTPQTSELSYLPLTKLFNADGDANNYIFDQIPSGSVVAIVRPDWPIRDEFPGFPHGYGTNLNVSHLGIVARIGKDLMFYNASSLHQKVECEPLQQYLKKYIDSPTIKGIHVEKIIY